MYKMWQAYYFGSPSAIVLNTRENNSSTDSSLHWDDGHIPFSKLSTVLNEAVAGYAHLYAYGSAKRKFLSELIHRPSLSLEDFNCPRPGDLKPEFSCAFPCHKFPSVHCASRTAHCVCKWLMFYFQTKTNVPQRFH